MRQGRTPEATNGFDMLGLLLNLMHSNQRADISLATVDSALNFFPLTHDFDVISQDHIKHITKTTVEEIIPPAQCQRDIMVYRPFGGQEVHWCFALIGCGSYHPERRWSGQGATHGKNSYHYSGC